MENNEFETKFNPLLKREEIGLTVSLEKTPSNQEALRIIAEKCKKPEENISIKKIEGKFGRKIFTIFAHTYGTKEDKEKSVIKKRKKEKAQAIVASITAVKK